MSVIIKNETGRIAIMDKAFIMYIQVALDNDDFRDKIFLGTKKGKIVDFDIIEGRDDYNPGIKAVLGEDGYLELYFSIILMFGTRIRETVNDFLDSLKELIENNGTAVRRIVVEVTGIKHQQKKRIRLTSVEIAKEYVL